MSLSSEQLDYCPQTDPCGRPGLSGAWEAAAKRAQLSLDNSLTEQHPAGGLGAVWILSLPWASVYPYVQCKGCTGPWIASWVSLGAQMGRHGWGPRVPFAATCFAYWNFLCPV